MPSKSYPIPATEVDFEAVMVSLPDPTEVIEVNISIRRKPLTPNKSKELFQLFQLHPKERNYLTHDDVIELFGPSEEDVKKVKSFLSGYSISITSINEITSTISIKGSIKDIENAFDFQMGIFQASLKVKFISYKGVLSVPANLSSIIHNVYGFYHQIKKEYRRPNKFVHHKERDIPDTHGYNTREIIKGYNFPPDKKGKGQTIAIVELGGVYKEDDFRKYFKKHKIKEPFIKVIGHSETPESVLSDSEVTLDVEIAGSIVPEARIIIYYDETMTDVMRAIVSDIEYKPDVVSISWAGNEDSYTPHDVAELSELLYLASLMGITVVSSSGDHNAYNNQKSPTVQLPSSHPLVLGCGGTTLELDETTIKKEQVWNEWNGNVGTGGGFSQLFYMPYYQYKAIYQYPYYKMLARGVPDVSANASMVKGYNIVFQGKEFGIGGTSSATPLWACLIAIYNQSLGYRMGFINSILYELMGSDGFRQVTEGNNKLYYAHANWNPCCGLGSPNGNKLLELIQSKEPK